MGGVGWGGKVAGVTRAEDWGEGNRLSRPYSQMCWWLTGSDFLMFHNHGGSICEKLCMWEGRQDWIIFCEDLWSLNEEFLQNWCVFQYPIRPASMTYDDVTHLSAKIKPKQQKVGYHLSPVHISCFILSRMYFRKSHCAVKLLWLCSYLWDQTPVLGGMRVSFMVCVL